MNSWNMHKVSSAKKKKPPAEQEASHQKPGQAGPWLIFFFHAAEQEDIGYQDLGNVMLLSFFVGPAPVLQLAADGDLLAFMHIFFSHPGETFPGNGGKPLRGLNLPAVRVGAVLIAAEDERGYFFTVVEGFHFGVAGKVANELYIVADHIHF
jgi:hypothetical protein